jgi:hypothetical protein
MTTKIQQLRIVHNDTFLSLKDNYALYLLGSDLYTGVALSGAVELPAVFLTYIVIQRAGDKQNFFSIN